MKRFAVLVCSLLLIWPYAALAKKPDKASKQVKLNIALAAVSPALAGTQGAFDYKKNKSRTKLSADIILPLAAFPDAAAAALADIRMLIAPAEGTPLDCKLELLGADDPEAAQWRFRAKMIKNKGKKAPVKQIKGECLPLAVPVLDSAESLLLSGTAAGVEILKHVAP